MRDPFSWSFPFGRLFGIAIRVHFLFPLVALGLVLRVVFTKEAAPGIWVDAATVVGLLFGSVLLHELGHCLAAWRVGGEAQEVLIWPLGGLASVDVPHTPRANFIATAAGPAVNVIICVISGFLFLWLTKYELRLPLNPMPYANGQHASTMHARGRPPVSAQ